MEDPSGSGGWRFAQCFGDKGEVEDITEGAQSPPGPSIGIFVPVAGVDPFPADIISTVEFDSTGNYLATGDKGGRVVLFERNEMVCHSHHHCHLRLSCTTSGRTRVGLRILAMLILCTEKGV